MAAAADSCSAAWRKWKSANSIGGSQESAAVAKDAKVELEMTSVVTVMVSHVQMEGAGQYVHGAVQRQTVCAVQYATAWAMFPKHLQNSRSVSI